jgi:hypothetical protein
VTDYLSPSGKVKLEDHRFNADVEKARFKNILFVRLIAKKNRFVNVDFRYCTFDACYLRDCSFDSCDFTGSRFVNCNLHGSSFVGCKFDYTYFEKTDIDNDVLSSNCPGPDNLKLRFARTLRINYQQLGDAESVNKAVGVELEATASHLYKSWRSSESYYRKKYARVKRIQQYFKWLNFKALDFLWGNGESATKLGRTALVALILITILDVAISGDTWSLRNYLSSFLSSPQILLGISTPPEYHKTYIAVLVFVRLVLFGLFMAILVKRLNRR